MIFNVDLIAFMRQGEGEGDGADADVKVRRVEVPNAETFELDALLERIFYYGQNDFQPQPGVRSVSVGDVVRVATFDGAYPTVPDAEHPAGTALRVRRYIVMPFGFRELTPEQLGGERLAYDLELSGRGNRTALDMADFDAPCPHSAEQNMGGACEACIVERMRAV